MINQSNSSSRQLRPSPLNPEMDGRAPHPCPLPIGSADVADAER
jgi:hypothetical protein